MDFSDSGFVFPLRSHRGGRQHRFMESADINAAFRHLFAPLRSNIRRGLTNEGQLYAIEMDACIPGALLGIAWIPAAARGIDSPARLADPARRHALFDRLLSEAHAESLFAYVCERPDARTGSHLVVEIASADGRFAAEYPVCSGRGRRHRDLQQVPHRRLDPQVSG